MAEMIRVRIPDLSGWEMVPADEIFVGGAKRYVLVSSPVLIDGLASGDEILVDDDGVFRLVCRSGNVALKFSFDVSVGDEAVFEKEYSEIFLRYGMRLDGVSRYIVVATAPVAAGLKELEKNAARMTAELQRNKRCSGWWFGNVFDEHGKPLNWWL